MDEPIVAYHGTGTANKQWLYRNWQGSVVALADTSGAVASADIYSYGPYGEPNATAGSFFRYTGQLLDAETGLYSYKARYYSPALGRFLQTDPIGYEDQMNLYAYVHNDPVNMTDPSGQAGIAAGARLVAHGALAGIGADIAVPDPSDVVFYKWVAYAAVTATAATVIALTNDEVQDHGDDGSSGGPGEGKRFKPESAEEKAQKEGVPCEYCGQETTNDSGQSNSRERDYKYPKSRGGNNSSDNEADSCRSCNREKGNKTPSEYKDWKEKRQPPPVE